MLQVTVNGGETRVSFDPGSKLNIAKAGEAKNEFARIVKGENGRLVLDLANLDYIDSSGVGALLSLLRLCKEHKWTLALVNPQQANHFGETPSFSHLACCRERVFIGYVSCRFLSNGAL